MSKIKSLPDSGERRKFETGSVRDKREGKGRFDLISPIALRRLAKHYENGMSKYGERNWEKGQPLMSYIDSAERHIQDWKENRLTGKKDKEDHMAAVMWNIAAFIHTESIIRLGLLPESLDDVPKIGFPPTHEEIMMQFDKDYAAPNNLIDELKWEIDKNDQ